jgi:hypothetical protein
MERDDLPEAVFLTGEQKVLLRQAGLEQWRAGLEERKQVRRAAIRAMDRSVRCPPGCLEHLMHVYVICYGKPTLIRSRDYYREPFENYPIDHYVGWTQQQPPVKRVREHAAMSAHFLVEVRPGTTSDEFRIKYEELCPKCGRSLWYYRTPKEAPPYDGLRIRRRRPRP